MRGIILRALLGGAAAAIAATTTTVAQQQSVRESPWPAAVDAPASVAYLRDTYGVSLAEAQRRLALQRVSPGIAAQLAARFPAEYAGAWIDQRNGGVLTIAATRPAVLAAALASAAGPARTATVPAAYSLRELRERAGVIATGLGTPVGADVAVDERANEVVITTGGRISAGDRRLAGLSGSAGVRLSASAARIDKACDPLHCARSPMRGGIRLDVPRDNGTVGGCTTGFNLRAGGQLYVLTAGHCVGSATHTHLDTTSHDGRPVGVEDRTLVNTAYPTDYAIMPYQDGAVGAWFARRAPQGLVDGYCPGGCAGSRDVALTGVGAFESVQVGSVVCAAGAAYTPEPGETYVDSGAGRGYRPGLRCGEVFSTADGAIGVHICARPGDSGGPLFTEVDGKALGILTNGDPGSGPCTNPNERNYYSPLSKILADANSNPAYAGPDFTLARNAAGVPRRGMR